MARKDKEEDAEASLATETVSPNLPRKPRTDNDDPNVVL
jgi:hypothetical protein